MTPFVLNNQSKFGLKYTDIDCIIAIIGKHNEVEEAVIFGSRAKGNYKNGSDIDVALKGAEVNNTTAASISYLLNEETCLPYYFDVLNYHTVSNDY